MHLFFSNWVIVLRFHLRDSAISYHQLSEKWQRHIINWKDQNLFGSAIPRSGFDKDKELLRLLTDPLKIIAGQAALCLEDNRDIKEDE